MGIMVREFIQRIFRQPQQPAFDVASGGDQKLTDPRLLISAQNFFVGLRHEDKLNLYHAIYRSMPIAVGSVNLLVKLCNTRPTFKSGNPQVDARCKQIWKEIDGHRVNDQIIRQALIFGYSVGEMVFPSLDRISKVYVPDSPLIRFHANEFGDVTHVRQLNGTVWATTDTRGLIPAGKFIRYIRDPISGTDFYGSSLFESATDQLESLCKILQAQISVYMRLGRPRFIINLPSDGCTPEQFKDRLDKAKAHFAQLSQATATDIYMPTGVDIRIIGAESFGQRFADETRLVISCILAAVGIPAALLNVHTQASGGAESFVRQQQISMQSTLDNIQDGVCAAWNSSFWTLVAALEGMPVVPVMDLENVRILEMLMEEQARLAKRQNDEWECVAGIRDPLWLAQQIGADDVYDMDALTAYIEQQRTKKQDVNDNPTNITNTTKGTDERGTSNDNL